MSEKVLELWQNLEVLFKSAKEDVTKNLTKDVISAGVRGRKALRQMRKDILQLTKESVLRDKEVSAKRKLEHPTSNRKPPVHKK